MRSPSSEVSAGSCCHWWITATAAEYPADFTSLIGGRHVFVAALDLVVVAAIARCLDPEELRTPRDLIESIAAACSTV